MEQEALCLFYNAQDNQNDFDFLNDGEQGLLDQLNK